MTELTTIEANVLNIILPYRFDKPIKFEKVQERTKLGRRTLQNVLEALKKKGHPVGSHKTEPFGLYMAKTREGLEIGMRANVKQAEFNNDYEEDSFIIVDCITKTNRRKRIKVGVSYVTAINKITKQEYLERINNIAMEGVYSNGI